MRSILMTSSARIFRAADDSAAAGAAKAPKPKTVADDMDGRRIFDSLEDAVAYLTKCSEELSDFAKIPLAAAGLIREGDDAGNFDPEVYTDGMAVMVATLRKAKGGIKAIVVAPVPKLETLLDSAEGKQWAERILQKEFNHVAVRQLREAADVATVVDQIPTTVGAYITSGREAGAGIMEAFNELYKNLNAVMGSKLQVWARARFNKSELRKAFESTAYAKEVYPAVENRGEGKESLFVFALKLAIQAAKGKGLDPAIFQRWLDTRDEKEFTADELEDEDDMSFDSLSEALLADDSKDDAPAEGAADETPAPAPDSTAGEQAKVDEPTA